MSHLHADPSGAEASPGVSTTSLVKHLIDDVARLVRQEVSLARAEIAESLDRMRGGATLMTSGLVIGLVALIVLVQALVIALSRVMDPIYASLAVGVPLAAIALALIAKGRSDLDTDTLVPRRAVRSLRRDKDLAAERLS